MKKLLHIAICLLAVYNLSGQTISGKVYDENKLPLPGASVYLDGTSTGTVTSDDGSFELQIPKRINTVLVFSFIGYGTETVTVPSENRRFEVHLKPKTDMLREVVIQKGGFTRKQMLAIFLEEFLGRSKAGRSCKILNPDDINLRYDYKQNRILATSDAPLKIENPYLGYEIDFNLIECYVVFSRKSVSRGDVMSNAFSGTTAFKELADTKDRFAQRRRDAYFGSQTEFFRNLVDGKWDKEKFQLFKGSYKTDASEWFEVVYAKESYHVKVLGEAIENSGLTLEPKTFYAHFNLLYDKQRQSGVIFRTGAFTVDSFGNTDSPMDIVFTGEISKLRAGDLLPIDYSP
ncbi:carboxypeptidase-like regulatory domain-containing protein [Flavobacterium selenitireducens]|uniref:carboxypeptidase-like regulatory domain-containing protein n=1 Tax=Flavobacterium selenitireducens TaxID=2722704 RepID=UPI00168BBA34|nr:carboxypeptidase-like regulatory domain-containing protein [Flavobacterium selenitireducens]MBD3581091.1 hypothetical protein [Flavobacterium selenitireducens]